MSMSRSYINAHHLQTLFTPIFGVHREFRKMVRQWCALTERLQRTRYRDFFLPLFFWTALIAPFRAAFSGLF